MKGVGACLALGYQVVNGSFFIYFEPLLEHAAADAVREHGAECRVAAERRLLVGRQGWHSSPLLVW